MQAFSSSDGAAEQARWSATGGVPGGWMFSVFVIDFSVRARGSPGGVRRHETLEHFMILPSIRRQAMRRVESLRPRV